MATDVQRGLEDIIAAKERLELARVRLIGRVPEDVIHATARAWAALDDAILAATPPSPLTPEEEE